jgi:sialic acid synthase SpsE
MIPEVKIGDFIIGPSHPPFVVAEAGINHNGELEKAIEMVQVAKRVGADAIKFQTFKADEFVGDPTQTYTYLSRGKEVTESMLAMFRRYELPRKAWFALRAECEKERILFLSTPQNQSDLELLLQIGISAIKVGSDEFTNLPLLASYAKTGLPLILSCGMSNLGEVYQTLETVGTLDGYPTILLLCTSQYPTPPEDVNLAKLRTLQACFPMVVTGFSDHTQESLASPMATAFGACYFEKHFTLDHDLPGPDHWFSENPQGLEIWVKNIRTANLIIGNTIVRPTAVELINKTKFQRKLVAAQNIKQGSIFGTDNITLRRVSDDKGLPPFMFSYLIGKVSPRAYQKGEIIDL